MGMFEQVLADMRERAAVAHDAAKNDPDGTVHHEAVANMLEYLAARAEEAHKREIAELKKEEKRKKKYEYAIKFDDGDIDCVHSEYPMHSCYKLVRREVGEWKEVK